MNERTPAFDSTKINGIQRKAVIMMTIEYHEKINVLPDTEGLNFVNQMIVDTLPLLFSSDMDDTIREVKRNYESNKNDLFIPAAVRAEKCLFRLYEAKYLILPHCSIDLAGFCFDDVYHAFVKEKVLMCYDRARGEKEYEQALKAVGEKDYVTAGTHFRNAAFCGHVDAQYNYGVSLSNGELGEADPLEGAFWYFTAAKGGNAKAMVNLAIAYRKGTGVYPSGPMMIYWYAKAATIPHPYAVYCLGLCLQNEEVISNNISLGYTMKTASEQLMDDEMREFAVNISAQIVNLILPHTFNT